MSSYNTEIKIIIKLIRIEYRFGCKAGGEGGGSQ